MNHSLINTNKIRFFNNLSAKQIKQTLNECQIKICPKNKILFFAQSPATNFYIVLEGSLKLYNSNEDGLEAVLQIISANNFLGDFFSKNFQANAKALEDTKLIFLPTKKLQELVQNNSILAQNILLETATQNQELLAQINDLKLTSSKKKLGQFLLDLAFENGANKAKEIKLKFEKSLIASYLGMKPETLSRTLQKLKNDGEIIVKKNHITLPQEQSLCNYCNEKIAAKCSIHKTLEFCP